MYSDTFQRITILRYLMIVGIVFLHTPPYVPVVEVGSGLFDQIKAFFQNAAFRATVPVLTVISGYLLFRAGLDMNWKMLAQKKARTILIPFLVFNLGLLAVAYCMQRWLGISTSYQLIPFKEDVWINAAFGLTAAPINYPLNFLRDLLAVMILAPLMGILLRRVPWLGLLLVIGVFFFNLDGRFVLRDVMPIMFYIGGMAAVMKWNLQALDRFSWLFLIAFVISCFVIVHFRIANTNYFRFLAPFLIWPATALLTGNALGAWIEKHSKYSFFIFVAHAPVLLVLSMAYQKMGKSIPYPVYWVCAPVIVVIILTNIYRFLVRFAPVPFLSAIGSKPISREKSEQASSVRA